MSVAWEGALICIDPELAQLDRELASSFEKAKGAATGPSRQKLVRAQRSRLGARREECDHGERRTCLVAACRKRLAELKTP